MSRTGAAAGVAVAVGVVIEVTMRVVVVISLLPCGLLICTRPVAGEETPAGGRAAPASAPRVAARPGNALVNPQDSVRAAGQRPDALTERVMMLDHQLRNDTRLRNVGALMGMGALALGAVRRQNATAFVGTQALRIGFDRQLAAVRDHTGCSVAASVGRRGFSVVVSREMFALR
jgi:hypothetical protein